MTKGAGKEEVIDLKGLLARDEDFVRATVEALIEAEISEAISAAKGERTETRLSYRSGYYSRSLITRVCGCRRIGGDCSRPNRSSAISAWRRGCSAT